MTDQPQPEEEWIRRGDTDEIDSDCLIEVELKHGKEEKFRSEFLVSIDCPRLSQLCEAFRLMLYRASVNIPEEFRFLTRNGWPVQVYHENEVKLDLLLDCNTIRIQKIKGIYNDYDDLCFVGIKLKCDGFSTPSILAMDISSDKDLIIGTVTFPALPFKADELRYILKCSISSLPENFIFLSKEGYPIPNIHEKKIYVPSLIQSGLISIQRKFAVPRLGIKWYDGPWIGYISIDFNAPLTEVRDRIHTELTHKFCNDENFEFIKREEWPISRLQEAENTVFDVCIENYCVIRNLETKQKPEVLHHKAKKRPLQLNEEKPRKKSFHEQSLNSNSILISYVHCEAMSHARNLKDELRNMGLNSVFLDIDDIPAGQDWQDVINSALNNCSTFVALVTPRYGETRWTNREAKLADDKEKLIIPISFLRKWPPDQLAIQFLSKQYIPWRTDDEFVDTGAPDDDVQDITFWDQRCVHRVAKEIKKLFSIQEVSTPDSLSLLDDKNLENGSQSFFNSQEMECKRKDYIVVSAHCDQKPLVEKILVMLQENGFDGWSSIDMAYLNEDIDSACDDSQISEASPVLDSYSHAKAFRAASFLNRSRNFDSQYSDGKNNSNECENLQSKKSTFKWKIRKAYLVVIILSQEYMDSSICMQQAFYCEQRREVIVIKYGEFQIDNIVLNFYPEQDMLKLTEHGDSDTMFETLKREIIKTSRSNSTRKSYKDRIQSKVTKLSAELNMETCVYLIGRTERLSKNAEQFCVVLGTELAKLSSLVLVTEGFFGVCEFVGKNFCEEREIRDKGNPKNVYHVIPYRDAAETEKGRQDDDGSFHKLPYGQTLFYGDSISERDDIVTSTFKTCIFIDGDERSSCLAEKFLWNDCTVIPIIFNSRAISSKHCLGKSLSKVPCGVMPNDWFALTELDAPDLLAKTVKKIVSSLLKTRKLCNRLANTTNKIKH